MSRSRVFIVVSLCRDWFWSQLYVSRHVCRQQDDGARQKEPRPSVCQKWYWNTTAKEDSLRDSLDLSAPVHPCKWRHKHLLQRRREKENLIVESDCLTLVDAILSPSLTSLEIRVWLAECAELLPLFPKLHIQHCRREANFIADWVTKAHGRNSLPSNWVVSPPKYLLDLLCTEAHFMGPLNLPTWMNFLYFRSKKKKKKQATKS